MNGVIYVRCNSSCNRESMAMAIRAQINECFRFAEAKSINVVNLYIDMEASGTTDKRPDFLEMIADSGKGKFEAIIVHSLNRFSRDTILWTNYRHKLEENGVKILSVSEDLSSMEDTYDLLFENIIKSINEYQENEFKCK